MEGRPTYGYDASRENECVLLFQKGLGMLSFHRQHYPLSIWYPPQLFCGRLAPRIHY